MAEIKIRDLSIGDWVRYDFPEIGKRNIQVNSIDEEDNHIGAGGVGASVWSDVSEFEPIPLTPEILEKNGFVKKNYDNGKMWDWWCDNVLVRKFADEDIYRCIVALNPKHYTTMMVVVKHTHQLQHALRLTGVGKEIEV